ncbi:hypothetical protein [Hyalangium minutum]|uniref:Lipoprotein n=1 Tax=Hyalangium minutum TaxID=394096 RepID=A0A085WLH5_9BACT|nr:hypothetical protein [Hyalangium minutum]KFE68538.1 hypothetical protein DB31_7775 [Hyalangium minutum]
MCVWRFFLCCGVMLIPAGCAHTPAEPTVRTKGGDSATTRISTLIAQGQLTEAEELLLHAIAAGLISHEAAQRLQKTIRERQQQPSQQPGPNRFPPVDPWVDVDPVEDPSGQRRNCGEKLPDYPVCQDLPAGYAFHSAQQALNAMKLRLDSKNLLLHHPEETRAGPCPLLGRHYNMDQVPHCLVGLPIGHERASIP